jgi:riboflavin synthase
MFTGLIADIGSVERVETVADGSRLRVRTRLASELAAGDSVAVNGACLTAASVDDAAFEADVMNQTLRRTSLGPLEAGAAVNLELALRVGDRLGGHLVQGHVDGTGRVVRVSDDGIARRLEIEVPAELCRYVVERGSVTVDGVSLTVAALTDTGFEVSLVPETLERTTLGEMAIDRVVNLEVDVLARYVESLMSRFEEKGKPQ